MNKGVRESRKLISGLIVIILFVFSLNISTLRSTSSINDHSKLEHNILTLTPHNPIIIDNDFQFTPYSSSGSGTKSNPYIIENYNITTSDSNTVGIHIADTTSYFVIRNCYVEVEGIGISISNVAHGTASIVNNTLDRNYHEGISINHSSGVNLTNNRCNNNRIGILLNSASSSIVVNNTCSATDYGIFILDSPSSSLLNNTLYGGGLEFREFNVIEDFMNMTVEDNWVNEKRLGYYTNLTNSTFSDPLYGQFFLINCTETIVANQEMSSIYTGLTLRWCENITLINNTCSNSDTGILLSDSPGSTLINNTCSNNNKGIYLRYSPGSSFINNTCSNNDYGIHLYTSSNSSLVNNTCSNNDDGIYLSHSSGSVIINNSLVNDGFHISESGIGGYLGYYFENNKVNKKELGYYINLDEVALLEPLYGQLFLINCTDSEVANQEIFNTTKGISMLWCENITLVNNTCNNNIESFRLESSSGLTIFNNTCNNNSIGMQLSSSSGLVLDNNAINDNYIGISLWYSPDSIVNNSICDSNYVGIWLFGSSSSMLINGVYSNSDHSIYIEGSDNSTLTNNTCNGNSVSIRLWYSSRSTLTNNSCNKNNIGIILEYTSESNIINNTCNNNTYGIYLWNSDSCLISYNLLQENIDYGVYLDYTSDYNILHHNIFVNNNQSGGSQAYDSGNNNTWFDVELLEGNYWSDLGTNCTYEIAGQAEAMDHYPLNRSQDCNISNSKTTLIIVSVVVSVFLGSAILFLSYRYYKSYFRKK